MTEGKDDFVTSVSDGGVDCVGYDDFVLDDVGTSCDGSAGAFFAPDEQSPVVVPVARGFGATELLVTPPGKYTVFELPPAVVASGSETPWLHSSAVRETMHLPEACLLYTSDAADE